MMMNNTLFACKKSCLSFFLYFALLFIGMNSFSSSAQSTIQIGSGSTTSTYIPIYPYFGYTYSQTIYTPAEMIAAGASASGGTISKIRYKAALANPTTNGFDWVVYLGNSSQASFSSTTNWIPTSSLTQVFSGTVPNTVAQGTWMEITLPTPFVWDGTSNVVVAVDENTPNYGSSGSSWY